MARGDVVLRRHLPDDVKIKSPKRTNPVTSKGMKPAPAPEKKAAPKKKAASKKKAPAKKAS